MKAKIKQGHSILFTEGFSNNWKNLKNLMIINFMDKYTYLSFRQYRNHLLIDTIKGKIDIVFTGETPVLIFDSFVKDQLVLKINPCG